MSEQIYKRRDHEAMGDHYFRHIEAMTSESLNSKSAIAGELAFRDARIAELAKLVEAAGNLRKAVAHLGETVQRDDDGGFRFHDDRLCKLSDRFTELMSALAEIEAAKEAEDDKD